ncbi:MAG: branched-chain amino acid ABC transporter permease [Bacilli bacterium]|nr:branched-chain amino acid ABC transporter permease [Bacilli bacterium]
MDFIITLINGLSLGGIYAMIALGYTMVYGIAKMLNFAHGDIIMVGGYTLFVVLNLLGFPIIAIIVAIILCGVLAILMEKAAYKPLRGASPLAVLITAIGVSYLLQSLSQIIFGTAAKFVVIADLGTINIGSLVIQVGTLVTLGATLLVMVGLSLFIKKTKVGRAMIAVSEDRGASELMGISVNNIITITFLIGAVLAAIASTLYLLKSPAIFPTFGSKPGIKAFTAAVIGGIGSIPGAMAGGILLGVIESFSNSVPAIAPYTDAIEFAILIIILLVRPAGLLGKRKREKV